MVVLVLGIAGFNEMENWWDTHNFKWGLPPWEETIYPTDTSDVDSVRYTETPDSAAVAYLNNNEKKAPNTSPYLPNQSSGLSFVFSFLNWNCNTLSGPKVPMG